MLLQDFLAWDEVHFPHAINCEYKYSCLQSKSNCTFCCYCTKNQLKDCGYKQSNYRENFGAYVSIMTFYAFAGFLSWDEEHFGHVFRYVPSRRGLELSLYTP